MEYFLKGKLKRDGRRYKAGDTIDLTEEQARPLAHVLSDEPVSAPEAPEEAEAPVTPEPEVTVGGHRSETGEPSLDENPEAQRAEAADVTPLVSAPEAPVEEIKTEPKRGQSGRSNKEKPQQAAPADVKPPVVDPSKDL